jgi:hypothetical protein
MGEMGEPKRKNKIEDAFTHLDFEYVKEMVKFYEYTNTEVDLSNFSYAEIQSHPLLYKVYISNFNN